MNQQQQENTTIIWSKENGFEFLAIPINEFYLGIELSFAANFEACIFYQCLILFSESRN